jgi:hypothetical protein
MINVINDDWNMQQTYEAVYQKQQECTNEYPDSTLQDICAMIKQLWDSVVIHWNQTKISATVDQRIDKFNWNYRDVWSENETDWLYTIIFETEGYQLPLTLFIDNNGIDAKCTYAFYLWDVKMPPQTLVVKYWWFLDKLEKSFTKELEKRNQQDTLHQNTTDELLDTIS